MMELKSAASFQIQEVKHTNQVAFSSTTQAGMEKQGMTVVNINNAHTTTQLQ